MIKYESAPSVRVKHFQELSSLPLLRWCLLAYNKFSNDKIERVRKEGSKSLDISCSEAKRSRSTCNLFDKNA